MPSAEQLPEGTDTIIDGAGVSGDEDFGAETGTPPSTSGESDAAVLASGFVPEGTADDGADKGQGGDAGSAEATSQGAAPADLKAALFGRFDEVKGQAGDKAREYVQAGKDRATSALDDLVRMVEDAAGEVDAKLGAQYGDYARRAAEGLGSFSDSFKQKEVDELFDQARALIAKSPAAAAGVAAALGFVVARLVRSGMTEGAAADKGKAA